MSTYDFSKVPPISESDKIKDEIRDHSNSYREFINYFQNRTFWFRSGGPSWENTVDTLVNKLDQFLFYSDSNADRVGEGQLLRMVPITSAEIQNPNSIWTGGSLSLDKKRKVEILKNIFLNPTIEAAPNKQRQNDYGYSGYYRVVGGSSILVSDPGLRLEILNWSKNNYQTNKNSGNLYEAIEPQPDSLLQNGRVRIDYEIKLWDLFGTAWRGSNNSIDTIFKNTVIRMYLRTEIYDPVLLNPESESKSFPKGRIWILGRK
jgi:hypothetical protein